MYYWLTYETKFSEVIHTFEAPLTLFNEPITLRANTVFVGSGCLRNDPISNEKRRPQLMTGIEFLSITKDPRVRLKISGDDPWAKI